MDQTRSIDRNKPIQEQVIQILDSRYYVEDVGIAGGRFQLHKKVSGAIYSLMSDWFAKHPEEAKHYVED